MGHRHMLNALQIPETDGDQGWNHSNQPYKPIARAGAFESSSLVHHVENMVIQGGPFPSSAPRSTGHSSSILNAELTHYQPMTPCPSRDPFPHQPADRNSHTVPNNYLHHPSSSILSGQTVPRVDGAFHNQTMGRVSHKRKTPCVPQLCDTGSTSRCYDVGSSSNLNLPADPWHEKQNTEPYHTHRKYPTDYRINSLSIGSESMPRNVRSRAGADLEHNPVRAHLSSNFLHHPFSIRSSDQTNSVDFSRRNSNTPTTERNRLISPDGHVVTIGSGSSFFSHDPNTLNALNGHSNGSAESAGYSATSNRNTVPQNANCDVNQPIRGIRSGYDQRSAPTFRALSSTFQAGQVAASNEGLQMAAESYSSRHRRVVSTLRLLYSERNGRAGISSDRFRSSTEEALMALNRSALNGSRNPVDRHRDMRLDVDNMSYEELLVLGERIGSVSTGLSDNLISKCLTESIYCSSDQLEDDERCVICLEEYKHMDDVGNLKCNHDFHVGCIRKWLSLKNLCPICKASTMDESNKGK